MSQRNLIWLLAVPSLVLLTAVVSWTAPPPDEDYKAVREIVDVLGEVDRSYYRKLTPEQRRQFVQDMISRGLQDLDPNSTYFTQQDLKEFRESTDGNFGGIGAYLGIDPITGSVMVSGPMFGSPAYDAGLDVGDLILKIDDRPTEDMTSDDARQFIKGKPGTPVILTVRRVGAEKEEVVTLTRKQIEIHPVQGFKRRADDPARWDYFADTSERIGYVKLSEFNGKAGAELKAALAELEKANARAIILDLRGNPGGLLDEAVQVSDFFLPTGTIVSTEDRNKVGRKESAKKDGTFFENPEVAVVVLVDSASASASEIVAAALQENGRGVLAGQRSFGKGSVQNVFELPDRKAAVKLTTAVWLTPKGNNIHRWPDSTVKDAWGVKPDEGLDVKLSATELRQYQQFRREADRVPGKGPQPRPERQEKDALKPADKVLEKALQYLRPKLKKVGGLVPNTARPA